ncbi:MAG: AraC family transcriptional regulator [Bacteroidales bacterium]|nr:AraC family transcriptional regulator [Bacteroidales bacterium]
MITILLMAGSCPMLRCGALYPDKHQKQVDHLFQLIEETGDSLKKLVAVIELDSNLTEKQKARINLIRSKILVLQEMIPVPKPAMGISVDTNLNEDPLLYKAKNMIVQSKPDQGIPLIMKYLETVDNQSDSAVYARIYLAEAYRQKQEYNKGIGIIYQALRNNDISTANRAFACNRIAALYHEMPPVTGNEADSVIKYSRLCIDLSEKENLTEYLAASQNELGYYYLNQGVLDSALHLISKATENFLSINKYPQAINTYNNLAHIYYQMGRKEKSKEILLKALEMGNIENNRNAFLYIYEFLSDIYADLGDYKSALEYAGISHSLLYQFYNDRIQRQINEMSARFDLQEKEARIREEEHRSNTYRLQKNYLILVAVILSALIMILIFLFRFKSRAYNKLVAQNLKSVKLEKKFEQCLIHLSESDIRHKTFSEDQNSDLALRLAKFLAEEKPYLWSDITLDEFSKKLNTNRTYLSNLINERYNMSFYDLIFEYRIRTAIEYLNDPQHKRLSIEGIGELTGFKSSSTFFKKFKSVVGMTPNQFRERAMKS